MDVIPQAFFDMPLITRLCSKAIGVILLKLSQDNITTSFIAPQLKD